jgi:hypothetical protein
MPKQGKDSSAGSQNVISSSPNFSSQSASEEEEKVPIKESSSLSEDDLYASEEILGPVIGVSDASEVSPIIVKEPRGVEPPRPLALYSQPVALRVNYRPSNAESELQRHEILLTKQTLKDLKATALSLLKDVRKHVFAPSTK